MIKAIFINKRTEKDVFYYDLFFSEIISEGDEVNVLCLGGVGFAKDPTEEELCQRASDIASLNNIDFNPKLPLN